MSDFTPETRNSAMWSSDARKIASGKANEVILTKLGKMPIPDLSGIEAVQMGHVMEPVIGRLAAERLNISLEKHEDVYTHPDNVWLKTHIDFGGYEDIHRILVNPARPNRILVANGIVGVMTSDDNGKTWRKNPMPPEANYPDPMVIHPDQPDLVFLTAGVGWPPHWYKLGRARGKMFRSRDAGETWERLLGGLPNGQRATFGALTIEVHGNGYGLYAADTDGQIFESLDGGDNWCIIADVAPVSKGEFYRGLVKDRVPLATVDDVAFTAVAQARLAAVKT